MATCNKCIYKIILFLAILNSIPLTVLYLSSNTHTIPSGRFLASTSQLQSAESYLNSSFGDVTDMSVLNSGHRLIQNISSNHSNQTLNLSAAVNILNSLQTKWKFIFYHTFLATNLMQTSLKTAWIESFASWKFGHVSILLHE